MLIMNFKCLRCSNKYYYNGGMVRFLDVKINFVITTSEVEGSMEVRLSKALGFSIFKNLEKTLQNEQFGQGYMDLYNEMLKVSQDSIDKLGEEDGDIGTDLIRLKEVLDRRRSVRLRSAIGKRRSRSQALRREKLNSQSLRSHFEHSKHSSSSLEHNNMNR